MAKVAVYRFKGWDIPEGGYTEADPDGARGKPSAGSRASSSRRPAEIDETSVGMNPASPSRILCLPLHDYAL
jgi:hypothetical protein